MTLGEAGPTRPAGVYAWLQALFDESPMAIGFSRDGTLLDANPAYVRLFGHASIAELRGRSILDQIAPSHRAQIAEMVALRARGGNPPGHYQTRGVRKDGTEFPFEVTTTRVLVADGPLAIAFLRDASEREEAIQALRASEERFRILSAAAFEGVFVHAEGKVVLANEAGAAMHGFDPPASMIGVSVESLIAPESREHVARHIRSGAKEPCEGLARRQDGSTFHAEARGRTLLGPDQQTPMRVVVIRDVSERKRAEADQRALAARMEQTQKLESLGVLAGGIAHDFNNILTVIANGAALLKRDRALAPRSAEHVEGIALAARRGADLCRQMLAYAGKVALSPEAVDLSGLVSEMSSMLEVSVAKKTTLVSELASGLPMLLGDATQIRQVVMNLVLNASEALEDHPGRVVITTGSGTYGAGAFARSVAGGDPKPGTYVFLEVCDDGVGMDAATVSQMFDPFFTTKFTGRGLGMAAVLGIVRGHAGAIDVESSPGKGTRIRVFFPAVALTPETRATSEARLPAGEPKGHGVVLLVDDERNVRVSTQLLLEQSGFQVIAASDGVEGVELFRTHVARIGAVLLDLTMPRMSGIETLEEIRRIAPGVPVILTSGYGTTPWEGAHAGSSPAVVPDAVLAKPYAVEQLFDALDKVMRAPK
jgi:two-component system, cell cycle sensor histidine kinase and response regulator CckA